MVSALAAAYTDQSAALLADGRRSVSDLDLVSFPVTLQPARAGQRATCVLCQAVFLVDERGAPVLTHPELGAIVVCYPCARDLGEVGS